MKMKILLTVFLFITGVANSNAQGTWTQKADFGGTGRRLAVGFSIGSKGYIGTGADISGGQPRNDFWEYDPATNTWAQKADFGGTARDGAVGFSIGSKGYIGTGYDGSHPYRNDFWEYDPAANTWTPKADFGGSGRISAVGFSIGNKGYIGTGYNGSYDKNDFWEYDPVKNVWTRKADFGGDERLFAAGFSIGSKGYIGTGLIGSSLRKDFWEYDPAVDKWTQKADVGGGTRAYAVGFSIGNKGYLGTGSANNPNFWTVYDPITDSWTRKADFEGSERTGAVGFSIGSKGYIGTGSYTKDFWEYTPDENFCLPPSNLKVTNITDTSVMLHGTIPDSSVRRFMIAYRATNTIDWIRILKPATSNHFTLKGLSPNTTYEWGVRSLCGKDTSTSEWVKGPNFTTASSFVSNEMNITLSISPNPVTSNLLTVHFISKNTTNIQIIISDVQGQTFIKQRLPVSNDILNRTIDVSALPKGIYILKVINSKNELEQIKFVKAN
ncbi:T9SS type A sorting domain-containing protein [Panacibacter ginsenosidivorans]|uniref:T9SS type A sorting domain-containing protein n=1 Tax=Panacibacter ginsenosidivorans TaxID=1813871 RepID=A0A5B8VFW0_9BACT|nr:kelch repeat-containing protein [Panacibacter ginsenosidivorans]QEC69218.1 T9SS type A sorting domain-containing protein [Panacibacter ginsenosidivorans]